MMKCSVVLVLWVGLELVQGGALRCVPGEDSVCAADNLETVHPARIGKALSGKVIEENRGVYCLIGSKWDSTCGKCSCSEFGRAQCERRAGCTATDEELEKQCAPDTMWLNACNSCWCSDQGRAMCTRIGCAYVTEPTKETQSEEKPSKDTKTPVPDLNQPLVRKSRATEEKQCNPGQNFRLDCNICLCDDTGTDFSCTRHDCNAPNGGDLSRSKRETSESSVEIVTMQCVAGSVFNRECNVCRCAEGGQRALCTHKPCSPRAQPLAIDSVTNAPESDPNFRCNPGEQLKRGCNDCQCSADGRSVFCTVRFCDQDITPPPSTV